MQNEEDMALHVLCLSLHARSSHRVSCFAPLHRSDYLTQLLSRRITALLVLACRARGGAYPPVHLHHVATACCLDQEDICVMPQDIIPVSV